VVAWAWARAVAVMEAVGWGAMMVARQVATATVADRGEVKAAVEVAVAKTATALSGAIWVAAARAVAATATAEKLVGWVATVVAVR